MAIPLLLKWSKTGGLGLIFLITLMGLNSCTLLSGAKPIDAMSLFTDIPVPKDMVVNQEESIVHDNGAGRIGILIAKGYMVEKDDVLDFYRQQMPLVGWKSEGEFATDDRHMLVFTKDKRSVVITVTGNWILSNLEVHANVRQP